MKTPTFDQSTWASTRSTDVVFQLWFSSSTCDRWRVVHCLWFRLLLPGKRSCAQCRGAVPVLEMLRETRHWRTEVCPPCLCVMSSLWRTLFKVLRFGLGVHRSASSSTPPAWRRVWPSPCSLQRLSRTCCSSDPRAHRIRCRRMPAAPPLASLTVLFLYIFLSMCIYAVYRKQNFYFVTQGSEDRIKDKEAPVFWVFI